MPPGISATLLTLEENPRELYLEVTSVLLRVANNVIKNPSEPKYRSIRLANPTVANKLLPAVGAIECLFEMGFKEADDCLVLPPTSCLKTLQAIHDQILVRRNKLSSGSGTSSNEKNKTPVSSVSSATSQAVGSQAATSTSKPSKSSSENRQVESRSELQGTRGVASVTASGSQNTPGPSGTNKYSTPKPEFLERIVSASQIISLTHKKEQLELAKSYIPLAELETAALEQLRKIQKVIKRNQAEKNENVAVEPSMQELVLIQLLSWFKEKFFSWVNNPPCKFCSGKTKFLRTDSRGDLRVEVYECAVCFQETDFPRHTDPVKLLETRSGRCGEWGRCFTFLCLSLGWDSRLVIDETDHVWTEVFLTSQSRWVHCDSCENAFDTPLMYELGWKKKLSYILAYSPDDVQDVTWRYSANHKAILQRRQFCTEAQLLETIMNQRKLIQQNLSPTRKAYLLKRTLLELTELWKEPSEKDGVYQGRQSGSLAWRISRGETADSVVKPYTWKPTQYEIGRKEMRIQYMPGLDYYRRGPDAKEAVLSGWQNGVNAVSGIFRKEEKDWKMVYLSREEGMKEGSVTWSVDLTGSGMVADSIKLTLNSKVFESGRVSAVVCGGDCCVKLPTDKQETSISTNALSGVELIKLSVTLTGGDGDLAWQHSQLFRSELGGTQVGLDFIIKLKPI